MENSSNEIGNEYTKIQKQNSNLDSNYSEILKSIQELGMTLLDTRKDIINYNKDIKSIIEPKFLTITSKGNDLIELAVEIWKLEQKLTTILDSNEEQKEFFANIFQKMKRFLDKNDIEIADYTNQKYNEGRNLVVLHTEKEQGVEESIIKETIEPTILHKGTVVRPGKIIVLEKKDEVEHNGKK